MRFSFHHLIGATCLGISIFAASSAAVSLTVTVRNQSMQQFAGLGLNVIQHPSYANYSDVKRQELARKLWKDGHFNGMRLWDFSNPGEFTTIGNNIPLYFDNHIVSDARANGVNMVMLETNGCGTVQDHVQFYASLLLDMKQKNAIIDATAFRNKPNTTGSSGACRWTPQQVVDGTKMLRRKLDSLGMSDIKLNGPETVEWFPRPAPEHAAKYDYLAGDDSLYLSAFVRDSAAMRILYALGTETYGKGITTQMQNMVASYGKEYWVTLCATDPAPIAAGQDVNYVDSTISPITAAQVLSDLNHGMTRWFGWAWADYIDIDDNQSTNCKPRYYFMRTIGAGFDPGARIRKSECTPASPTTDMHFNYGEEPAVTAAAGRNPDGTWAIGLVNLRGVHAQHYASYFQASGDMRCTVTVTVQELAAVDSLRFFATRCHGVRTAIQNDPAVVMRSGTAKVVLGPLDEVVLRSDAASAVFPVSRRGPGAAGCSAVCRAPAGEALLCGIDGRAIGSASSAGVYLAAASGKAMRRIVVAGRK
jgi:hypothetical protein